MEHIAEKRQTAVVTGASSGIGLGLTNALLEQGYRVAANSRSIRSSGALTPSDDLLLIDGDISVAETGEELIKAAVSRFASVGLLVNNAGVFIPKPFLDQIAEDFERLIWTNLAGFFHASQPALKQMDVQRSGHVVNITTTLADQPIGGVPAAIAILTKGGLNAVTRALAIEFAPLGIRVNAIAPGIVDTPMHEPEAHEFLKTLHPIQRVGQVSEIAEALLYLTGATFITGEVLHVDGGPTPGNGRAKVDWSVNEPYTPRNEVGGVAHR